MKRVFGFIGIIVGYCFGLMFLLACFNNDGVLQEKIPYGFSIVYAVTVYVFMRPAPKQVKANRKRKDSEDDDDD